MNGKEFTLTVKTPIHIKGHGHLTAKDPLHLSPGEFLRVSEADFESLKRGETLRKMRGEGFIELHKSFFENETTYVMVCLTYGKKSLGNRTKKENHGI